MPERQPLLAIRRVQTSEPVVDASLTPDEAALVRACLAPPENRPATALEVAEQLAEIRAAAH